MGQWERTLALLDSFPLSETLYFARGAGAVAPFFWVKYEYFLICLCDVYLCGRGWMLRTQPDFCKNNHCLLSTFSWQSPYFCLVYTATHNLLYLADETLVRKSVVKKKCIIPCYYYSVFDLVYFFRAVSCPLMHFCPVFMQPYRLEAKSFSSSLSLYYFTSCRSNCFAAVIPQTYLVVLPSSPSLQHVWNLGETLLLFHKLMLLTVFSLPSPSTLHW